MIILHVQKSIYNYSRCYCVLWCQSLTCINACSKVEKTKSSNLKILEFERCYEEHSLLTFISPTRNMQFQMNTFFPLVQLMSMSKIEKKTKISPNNLIILKLGSFWQKLVVIWSFVAMLPSVQKTRSMTWKMIDLFSQIYIFLKQWLFLFKFEQQCMLYTFRLALKWINFVTKYYKILDHLALCFGCNKRHTHSVSYN